MRKFEGVLIDDFLRQHFLECPECGDLIDMRDLDEVFNHHCGPRSLEELKADPLSWNYYDGPAANENTAWDAIEIEEIRAAIDHGSSVEEIATTLCRRIYETRLKLAHKASNRSKLMARTLLRSEPP